MSLTIMPSHPHQAYPHSPSYPPSSPGPRQRSSRTSYIVPPSVCRGAPNRPNVELRQPVWEVDTDNQCVVSGEVEVNVALFRRGHYQHSEIEPFSIGIAFSALPTSSHVAGGNSHEDEELESPVEWNQDPGTPGNYYRWRSYIQISERVMVDDVCYVRFAIHVPADMFPTDDSIATRGSTPSASGLPRRMFRVSVKAYELANPFVVTQTSEVKLMIIGRAQKSESVETFNSSTSDRSLISKRKDGGRSDEITSLASVPALIPGLCVRGAGIWGGKKKAKEGESSQEGGRGHRRSFSLTLKRPNGGRIGL